MHARMSSLDRSYSSMTCYTVIPPARKSSTRETQMRRPRIQGFPKQTSGLIEIRPSSSSRVIATPPYTSARPIGQAVGLLQQFLLLGDDCSNSQGAIALRFHEAQARSATARAA